MLLLALGACPDGTGVTVENRSGQRIEALSVEAAGETRTCGPLAPDARCQLSFRPTRDGSFAVSGRLADGTAVHTPGLDYTTPGDPVAHAFVVGAEGGVTVRR
jgi:hypothetical protein